MLFTFCSEQSYKAEQFPEPSFQIYDEVISANEYGAVVLYAVFQNGNLASKKFIFKSHRGHTVTIDIRSSATLVLTPSSRMMIEMLSSNTVKVTDLNSTYSEVRTLTSAEINNPDFDTLTFDPNITEEWHEDLKNFIESENAAVASQSKIYQLLKTEAKEESNECTANANCDATDFLRVYYSMTTYSFSCGAAIAELGLNPVVDAMCLLSLGGYIYHLDNFEEDCGNCNLYYIPNSLLPQIPESEYEDHEHCMATACLNYNPADLTGGFSGLMTCIKVNKAIVEVAGWRFEFNYCAQWAPF